MKKLKGEDILISTLFIKLEDELMKSDAGSKKASKLMKVIKILGTIYDY